MTAIQAHQRNMVCAPPQRPTPNIHILSKPFAVTRALKEANADIVKDIDGIAFTRGPGMPGCLSVGMNASKSMAAVLGKPLVGVHHMVCVLAAPVRRALTNSPARACPHTLAHF